MFAIVLLFLVSLFSMPQVSAQESSPPIQTYTRKIIVQTDDEQPVANHTVVCTQTPKKPGLVDEEEIKTHEITSNESGEVLLEVTEYKNFIFMCESKEPTTNDYCWYFPQSTVSFDIYELYNLNTPVYLVGQKSPETCNKEFTQEELEAGITSFLPQGTVLPFTNKNLIPKLPTPSPVPITERGQEVTLWQWFVEKIKWLFSL